MALPSFQALREYLETNIHDLEERVAESEQFLERLKATGLSVPKVELKQKMNRSRINLLRQLL